MSTVSLKDVFAELNVFFRHSQFVVAVVKGQQDVGHMDISRILWCFMSKGLTNCISCKITDKGNHLEKGLKILCIYLFTRNPPHVRKLIQLF